MGRTLGNPIGKSVLRKSLYLGLILSVSAEATWSIVAVDAETGQVGLAAATCGLGIQFIAAAAPGAGVVAAQGGTSFKGRDRARKWIEEGVDANEVLARLRDPKLYDGWLDRDFSNLQYGVATLSGGAQANHTGGDTLIPWFGGIVGNSFSVQGNTLRSENVVTDAAHAFEISEDGGCQLSFGERLIRAVEAGRDAGGDKRCPASRPAHSAILVIANASKSEDEQTSIMRFISPKEIGIASAIFYEIFGYEPTEDTKEPVQHIREKYVTAGGSRCYVSPD